MRPAATADVEPILFMGLTASEFGLLFAGGIPIWLVAGAAAGFAAGSPTIFGLVAGIGEILTVLIVAQWYRFLKRDKPDRWHLRMLAARFPALFQHVRYSGRWRLYR